MSGVRRLILALTAAMLTATAAGAGDIKVGELVIRSATVTPTRGLGRTTAGYIWVVSHSKLSDRLMSASCTCAASVELHQMWMDGAIMRMRKVEGGMEVPPGRVLILANGGAHLMLTGLKAPLPVGATVRMTFNFQRAGKIVLNVPVKDAPPMRNMPDVG